MDKLTQKLLDTGLVSVTIGVVIAALVTYFVADPLFKSYAYLVAGMVAVLPIAYVHYMHYVEATDIEKNFPIFLKDISENVRSGMTLVKAVENLKEKNYGRMSKYVKKIADKLDWGISFAEVMNSFADEVDNPLITRTVKTLIETHKFGGKIEDVLTAVVNSVVTIENLRKEREAEIFSQMINGYFIYIVFIGIMVLMMRFLVPMMASSGGTHVEPEMLKSTFRALVIIQSLFSGLIIGKMSEGTISAGFKHVLIMFMFGYVAMLLM